MSALQLGIIGTGRIAARMITALKTVPDIETAAVASPSGGRAQQFADGHGLMAAYDNIEDCLANDQIDAIYVANATALHAETAIAALKAGKPVLCEKPFSTSLAEAQEVISVARETGILFMEGFWTSLLPSWQAARKAVNGGAIGTPFHLYADFGYPASPASRDRLFNQPAGGCLLDRGVYPISLAVFLFGPAVSIDARHLRTEQGVDVLNSLTLTHDNGVISQLSASMVSKGANRAAIAGAKGRLDILEPLLGSERVALSLHSEAPSAPDQGGGLKDRMKQAVKSMPLARQAKSTMSDIRSQFHGFGTDQYAPMWQHFAQLLRSGKTESDVVTHDFSLEVARIVDEAAKV